MKKVVLLFLIISIVACKQQAPKGNYEIQETRLVERQLSRKPPSDFIANCELYVKASNDSIYKTNFLNLQNYHLLSHQNVFKPIQEFLLGCINQEEKIDLSIVGANQLVSDGFLLNQSVTDQYKRGGIALIKKLYCTDAESIQLKSVDTKLASTVSYYLFLNKYVKLSNDSTNQYKKINSYLY